MDKDDKQPSGAVAEPPAAASGEAKPVVGSLEAEADRADNSQAEGNEDDSKKPDGAAAPEGTADDDSDPEVQEVISKFSTNGKLDKKALAKAFKSGEINKEQFEALKEEVGGARQFLQQMRQLYQNDPRVKAAIDDLNAGKVKPPMTAAEVETEVDRLHGIGKHAEARAYERQHHPDWKRLNNIAETVETQQRTAQMSKAAEEAKAWKTANKVTKDEEEAMVEVMRETYERTGKADMRPYDEIWIDAKERMDRRATRLAELAARRGGNSAPAPKAPAPGPGGKTVKKDDPVSKTGDENHDSFLDAADQYFGTGKYANSK